MGLWEEDGASHPVTSEVRSSQAYSLSLGTGTFGAASCHTVAGKLDTTPKQPQL